MIFLFIYHFLIFQLSHSKQSIPLSGVLFSLVRTHHSPHALPCFLSNFALVVRDLPRLPALLRSKARAGNDGTKAGWHGYLSDCHPYQRGAFLSLINYDKEKNGSARQATDGADSGASAHE